MAAVIPVALDPAHVRIVLVGQGPLAKRRLLQLVDGGASPAVYSPEPDVELAALAGDHLRRTLPSPVELDGVHALFIVGIPDEAAETLARQARERNILVNVEDVVPLCDFHAPSVVRRGELLLTVSTGGRSPALAQAIRERLETLFPTVWADRLAELAALRDRLRAAGAKGPEVLRACRDLIAAKGWLP
ncbi:precorrin-2 dehydrogenase/sirohydrochlorin ferrochelatase family protein [Azospirillum isscasi]|uniref:precorrin-2 dehydrogenase n=1 Tax=Azospirillum isscasi TaxID=3053926 RepID=A0ABU0WAV7_9PROT|nr:NAD(P)-dependent oxidoreductase [Azospirillum isscasi]MDQ2101222.1 NAD(P)-dependent oxidoreductase [Azospirillum isscasi]